MNHTGNAAWPAELLAQGRAERRGGNQPINLDDRQTAWLVQTGQVELFLTSVAPNGDAGARHHLATVTAGGLLFGIETDDSAGFLLLALPHVDTDLVALPLDRLMEKSGTEDAMNAVAIGLEQWLRALSWGMARWAMPRPVVDRGIAPEDTLNIPAGQRVGGQQAMAWVSLRPENGVFLDIQELPANADEITFPLTSDTWLLAHADIELHARSSLAALRDGAAWQGLNHLHQMLFDTASMNLRLANADEFNRLKARRRATEAERQQALQDLRSVTDDASRNRPPSHRGDTPLMAALRLIGQTVGFEVQTPAHLSPGTAPTLDDLVRASGLRQRKVLLRENWWREDFGVLLAFDRESRAPLVLWCDPQGRPHLVDPVTGQDRDFHQHRVGVALDAIEFSAPLPDRALSLPELFGFAFRRGWQDAAWMLAMGALGALLALAIPVGTAYMIDTVLPNHEVKYLLEIGIVLALLGGAAFVVEYAGTLAFSRAESRMGRAAQAGFIDRLLRLPMGFFQAYSAGDLANRVMGLTQIQMLLSAGAVNAILSGLFGVFGLLLMFHYDAELALWALGITAIYVVLSGLVTYLRLLRERDLASLLGAQSSLLLQLILGVAKLRLAACEDRAFADFSRIFVRNRHHQLASQRLAAWQNALNQVFTLLGLLAFVFVIGKPSETPNLIAIGAFAALLYAFQQFASSLTMTVTMVTTLVAIQPQIERTTPLLQAMPEVKDTKMDPGTLSGAVDIAHITFRYDANDPLILDDISINVAPGEFIALVGPSGAGKSTLFRLLLGFETPESGDIFFDGQPFSRLDAAAVRRQMGVVMQDAQLMPGSLLQNIVGTGGGSLQEAWTAARQVGLADDIQAMPMGMQTVIMEGGGALSGGQMQRLMIARAIINRPKILLLDEATSALDNRTQSAVTESLDRLRVTRIVVAHRLSTVVNADRIFVFDHGRIVEVGSYADLMHAKGPFSRLAARQIL